MVRREALSGVVAARCVRTIHDTGWNLTYAGKSEPWVPYDTHADAIIARAVDDPGLGTAFAGRRAEPKVLVHVGTGIGQALGGVSTVVWSTEEPTTRELEDKGYQILTELALTVPIELAFVHPWMEMELPHGRTRGTYSYWAPDRVFRLPPRLLAHEPLPELPCITWFGPRAASVIGQARLPEGVRATPLPGGAIEIRLAAGLEEAEADYPSFEKRRAETKRALQPVLAGFSWVGT